MLTPQSCSLANRSSNNPSVTNSMASDRNIYMLLQRYNKMSLKSILILNPQFLRTESFHPSRNPTLSMQRDFKSDFTNFNFQPQKCFHHHSSHSLRPSSSRSLQQLHHHASHQTTARTSATSPTHPMNSATNSRMRAL